MTPAVITVTAASSGSVSRPTMVWSGQPSSVEAGGANSKRTSGMSSNEGGTASDQGSRTTSVRDEDEEDEEDDAGDGTA